MDNQVYLTLLGMKISMLRKEKGLTQSELAEMLDTGKTQVIRIERGEINSTINALRKIALVFDLSIEDLVKV